MKIQIQAINRTPQSNNPVIAVTEIKNGAGKFVADATTTDLGFFSLEFDGRKLDKASAMQIAKANIQTGVLNQGGVFVSKI